jgi:hypothetical protein
MDSYQAIYDAVRSRIGGADVAEIIRSACHLDASFAIEGIRQEFALVAHSMQEPCALYQPTLSIDGNQWCALYGDNIQDGVAGFGDSPAKAMSDFNRAWFASLAGAA